MGKNKQLKKLVDQKVEDTLFKIINSKHNRDRLVKAINQTIVDFNQSNSDRNIEETLIKKCFVLAEPMKDASFMDLTAIEAVDKIKKIVPDAKINARKLGRALSQHAGIKKSGSTAAYGVKEINEKKIKKLFKN